MTRREIAVWALGFLAISALLIFTRFASDDPDSALYAAFSAQLAEGPPSRWIAPEWRGHWDHEGLFREHPVGVFILPTLLGAMGVQAAYIVGIAAGDDCGAAAASRFAERHIFSAQLCTGGRRHHCRALHLATPAIGSHGARTSGSLLGCLDAAASRDRTVPATYQRISATAIRRNALNHEGT